MINLPSEKFSEGIYYFSNPDKFKDKEELYLNVRMNEGRIYNDKELKLLPSIERTHKHFREWQFRSMTTQYLIKFLGVYSNQIILDVGAGNCWLSNLISDATENFVFAVDLNENELKQGFRVFSDNKRLRFIYGDIFDDNFNDYKFDVILFSSSIQYFPDLKDTIERAFYLLHPDGFIIIIDSKFYLEEEVLPARDRTKIYYNELGFPEAAQNYFHHSLKDLNKFNFEILNEGSSFNKLLVKTRLKVTPPFPFIKIYNQ